MSVVYLFLSAALLVLSYGIPVSAQGGTSPMFATNVSLGSRGTQVILLQKMLNRDPDTRITNLGPGSPGNETTYFGPLTKAAVVRFQTKYADEVLVPAGLSQGSGYVGFYTRMKLNALSTLASNHTTSTLPPVSPAVATTSQNPNLKNLDKFIAAIDTVAIKQGLSALTLATIKEQVTKAVATTTDLHANFLKMVQDNSPQSVQTTSFIDSVVATVQHAFEKIFSPKSALAATGIPFGGALYYSFYCWNSNTWLLTLQSLPPSFATLLTYVPGSQAYLSNNIPATPWLLGEYAPGGTCVFACPYCVSIPGQGMITPMVGSSL